MLAITLINDILRSLTLFVTVYFSIPGNKKLEKKTLIKGAIFLGVIILLTGAISLISEHFFIQGRQGVDVILFNILYYITAYGLSFLFMLIVYKFKDIATILFYFVLSFFALRIGTLLVDFIYALIEQTTNNIVQMVTRVFFAGIWLSVLYLVRKRNILNEKIDGFALVFASFINATLVITIVRYAGTLLLKHDERVFYLLTFAAELFISVLCVVILLVYFSLLKRQSEKRVLHSIISQQKKVFSDFKENVDFINIKVHDLKHEIAYLEATIKEGDFSATKEALKKYDTHTLSDNEILNLVFENKQLALEKGHITQLYNISASDLSKALSEEEIFAFFSNAIDNVIEYYKKSHIKEEDRYLEISIKTIHDSLIIHIANKYEGKDKVPTLVTTKKSKANHGFGTKSMKYIIKRHNGNITFSIKEGVFSVDILLPLN